MIQRGEYLRLTREARDAIRIERQQRRQNLECDVAIELAIASAIDLAHRSCANQADDLVRSDSAWRSQMNCGGRNWQAVESSGVAGIGGEERFDFATQLIVIAGLGGQERRALPRRTFHCGLEQGFDALPSVVGHVRSAPPSSRFNHAFAVRHSRLAVEGDTFTDVRGLVDREPAKRAQLDDPGQVGIDGRQTTERVIERQQRHLLGSGDLLCVVNRDTLDAVTALSCAMTTRMVDENAAHRLCGHAEEVRSILPVDLALIDETQVDLVDERRRLQRVIHALASELTGSDAAQLGIQERQELVERGGVAATPIR
jgi:hypothetical protein